MYYKSFLGMIKLYVRLSQLDPYNLFVLIVNHVVIGASGEKTSGGETL